MILIMTHGADGHIQTCDHEWVNLQDLFSLFTVDEAPNLDGILVFLMLRVLVVSFASGGTPGVCMVWRFDWLHFRQCMA